MQVRKLTSRREFLALTVLGTTSAAILAACGQPPAPAPTAAPKPAAEPTKPAEPAASPKVAPAPKAEKITLTVWTHNAATQITYTQQKIEQFKQKRPEVNFEYAYAPVQDHDRKLMTTLAAKAGPDVFNNGDWNYPMLVAKGWVAPLDPWGFGKSSAQDVVNDYYEFALVGLYDKAKGDLYGIPIEWNALSLYYSPKVFREVGLDPTKPPQDWLSLTEMAVKLTKKDTVGNVLRPGHQISYGPGIEWPLKRVHGMILQLGGDILSADGKSCIVNQPEAVEAVQLYTDWTGKHKVSVKGFSIPGITGVEYFINGYYPTITNGPYYPRMMTAAKPDFKYKEDWDLTTFPQWPAEKNKKRVSPLWRWALFLNANSRYRKDASQFIGDMGGDWRMILDVKGDLPSVKGWDKDPAVVAARPWLATQMKDLEVGLPAPQTPKYQEIAQQILEMLERAETGAQTAKASADEAKQKIDEILKTP